MIRSVDNYKLRDALLERGFADVTSDNRSTKSWKLRHPRMQNWVSIKLAKDTRQPMATAPLVIHPDDARRVQAALGANADVAFEIEPYKGSSTKYPGGVLGRALSLADMSAIDAFVAAATGATETQPKGSALPRQPSHAPLDRADESLRDVDPVLLLAAAAEIDGDLVGRDVGATTRQQLIEARLGQGQFRNDMMRIWGQRCAVTGCGVARALVASHAIAWRDNKEPEVRLDPYNGLMLTGSIDRLFDQGLISFADDGCLLRKPELSDDDLAHLGLKPGARLRHVHERHLPYLAAHRARHGF